MYITSKTNSNESLNSHKAQKKPWSKPRCFSIMVKETEGTKRVCCQPEGFWLGLPNWPINQS